MNIEFTTVTLQQDLESCFGQYVTKIECAESEKKDYTCISYFVDNEKHGLAIENPITMLWIMKAIKAITRDLKKKGVDAYEN